MNWLTTVKKGGLGILTFVTSYLAANTEILTRFIPEKYASMTVGGFAAFLIVGVTNWLKHRGD